MSAAKLDPKVEYYLATKIIDRDDCGNYIYKNTRGKWETLKLNHSGWYYEATIKTKRYGKVKIKLHRLIFIRAYRKVIPKDWIIHHLDGNHENNHYTNLLAVPVRIHTAYHVTYAAAKTNPLHHIYEVKNGYLVNFSLYGFGVFKRVVHETLEAAIEDRNSRMKVLDRVFASYALTIPEYYT